MLNLPAHPGAAGYAFAALGAAAGFVLFALLLRRLRPGPDRLPAFVLAAFVSATVAGAPFTLWRVVEDIRVTAPVTPEHARYVGAETKLIDGELVERVAAAIPREATYYVAVSPDAYVETRQSLAHWAGYALLPRRREASPEAAGWILAWGATPARLGLEAGRPRLVGRNRLHEREPVYVARAR